MQKTEGRVLPCEQLAAHLTHSSAAVQVSVVTVGLDRGVFVWDIRQPNPVRVIKEAHLHEATCVAVNNRGNLIASGGADRLIKLWDFGTGAAVGSCEGHTARVNKCAFTPDDKQLASISDDSTLILWCF